MDTFNVYMNATSGVIVIGCAFIFIYFLWRQYVIDVTRQQLFELRDKLFDIAADGKIDNNSESYLVLREMFNSSIRFTHKTNVFFFIPIILWKRSELSKGIIYVNDLINSIDDHDIRNDVKHLLNRMSLCLCLNFIKRSPIFLLLFPIILLFMLIATLGYQFFDNFYRLLLSIVYSIIYPDAMSKNPRTNSASII
ncbi:MAG: hypothetical protein V3V99_04805 [candidate division Zixibacteria bacterium]